MKTRIKNMKMNLILLVAGMFLAATSSALATVRYVNPNNANPTPPYTNWATAATDIQDAVDAAGAGDQIVVTNGVYGPVTVNTPLTLQSVNGPDFTVIDGSDIFDPAWQCVYLATKAVLVGFTLANGATEGNGGGVYCESTNAVLTNCVLTGNSATYSGGGAYGATLNNCTLTGNWARFGFGGGAESSILNNCTLTGNSAEEGGGADSCTLNNCTLTGNSANGHYAVGLGGGACGCTLNNCTLTGNSAPGGSGGGAGSCTLNNCIVYFNSDNYDSSSTLNYCCTTPLPTNGVGNLSADPQLASAWYLSAESPCIGAGSAAYASGTDIDVEPWANPPSIGCEEYHAGAVTGPLTVSLTSTLTLVSPGIAVGLTGSIAGRTDLSVWEFGDGDVEVNEPYTSHTWTAPGKYLVSLWAFSGSYPAGVSATLTIHVEEHPVQYVAVGSANPVAPYLSWATAATSIQDAVDGAPPGGTILVTNGIYAPVTVNTPLTLQSVNGPDFTVISGANEGGMISEQLWDADDLPDGCMRRGRATGAAMPLCWSHAEYVSLVRSRHDGVCFDRIEPAFQRYVAHPVESRHEIWTLRHPLRRVPRGKILRIILAAEATIVWSTDGWVRTNKSETTHESGLHLWFADFPTAEWPHGSVLTFTCFWKSDHRWQGHNWQVSIL
jgi:hypothetical protein